MRAGSDPLTLELLSGRSYEFTVAYDMGPDHRIFTQAGVATTNIAFGGSKLHSPEDVTEQINIDSLEKSARIVLGVLSHIPTVD